MSPVTIAYHQLGACDVASYVSGGATVFFTPGPNEAWVLFGIESIDNSSTTSAFAFDPSRLFIQQGAAQEFPDPGLDAFLLNFAAAPATITPGQDLQFQASAVLAPIVSTSTTDGAVEADQTAYLLNYAPRPGDPPVVLVKTNASQTSFPMTDQCSDIQLQ
jgi:hypothetical protein